MAFPRVSVFVPAILSRRSVIDPTRQQLFNNNKTQYCKQTPSDTQFPTDIEGKPAKKQTTENPKNH